MSAENSSTVRISTKSPPIPDWQGKLIEAQSAGRDCPGSGAAGPQSGCGLDRNTRTGRIYCALLALIPSICYNYIIN